MYENGMTVQFDGEKNTILCNGIVKDYPIGGMICEYSRLHPTELKKVFDSYPQKNNPRNSDNLFNGLMWLRDRLIEEFDPVIALMCLTECSSVIFDLVKVSPEELNQLLDEANENEETKNVKQYILKDTGYDKFQVDTMGGVLSYCYYETSMQFIIFKHAFNTLMRYSSEEKEEEENLESKKKDEEFINVLFSFYDTKDIQVQHIDFKIAIIEGEFCSLYTIGSSFSLLLFELAHIIDNEVKIEKCKNCGHYFVINGRSDSKYCDYPSPQNPNKTCKAVGAQIAMSEKLKNDEATHLYRKIYMRNKMLQKRHPDDQKYPAILRKLVSEAKMWRKKLKQDPKVYSDYLKWVKQFDHGNE